MFARLNLHGSFADALDELVVPLQIQPVQVEAARHPLVSTAALVAGRGMETGFINRSLGVRRNNPELARAINDKLSAKSTR